VPAYPAIKNSQDIIDADTQFYSNDIGPNKNIIMTYKKLKRL